MCNACAFTCCAFDGFEGCGCDDCHDTACHTRCEICGGPEAECGGCQEDDLDAELDLNGEEVRHG